MVAARHRAPVHIAPMNVPSVAVVSVVPIDAVLDPCGSSAVIMAARSGSRHTDASQCKSGHEGHEEFLVVRVITILFLPLWALQVERETPDNNLTGQKNKISKLEIPFRQG